jgi:ribosomal protein L14E/L6E/L27E
VKLVWIAADRAFALYVAFSPAPPSIHLTSILPLSSSSRAALSYCSGLDYSAWCWNYLLRIVNPSSIPSSPLAPRRIPPPSVPPRPFYRDAGPYKINGVPLRRLNQAYVIATSTQVDVSKVDVSKIDDAFFARKAEKSAAGKDGEAFFAKDPKKTVVSAARKTETARVDAAIKAIVKATPSLKQYLNSKFTLTRGQKPHQLKF